jgi:hypothetical protein
LWGYGVLLKGSSSEYSARVCCEAYCHWENCSQCSNFDCTDPTLRGDFLELAAPYTGDCDDGGIEGVYQCSVWEREGKVVAVKGFCQN